MRIARYIFLIFNFLIFFYLECCNFLEYIYKIFYFLISFIISIFLKSFF